MSDDELRAAAEFILRCTGKNTPSGVVATAVLSAPRWHARPPVPGVYVMPSTLPGDYLTWPVTSDQIGNWTHGRVYGPVPPDPG